MRSGAHVEHTPTLTAKAVWVVYKVLSRLEVVIKFRARYLDIYIPGSETHFVQTCGPQAEYKYPSIMLLNLITPSKDSIILYKLPTQAQLQGKAYVLDV